MIRSININGQTFKSLCIKSEMSCILREIKVCVFSWNFCVD